MPLQPQSYDQSSYGREVSDGVEDFERLFWRHESMRHCLNGLYPCPETVRALLSDEPGVQKRILDVACGSRKWCLDMAKEFPHVEVWGIDMPVVLQHWAGELPDNCHFEAFDILDSIPQSHRGRYDLVHLRFVAGAFPYFHATMEAIQSCLKPGGLFILIDSTGLLLKEDKVTPFFMKTSKQREGSLLQRLFHEIRYANSALGLDELTMRAQLQEGLWDNPQMDECAAAELLIPIGSWIKSRNPYEQARLRKAGALLQKSLHTVQRGHISMLEYFGFPKADADKWVQIIDQELQNEGLRMSLDIRILWGRKRAADGQPAPPLPSPPPPSQPIQPTKSPKQPAKPMSSPTRSPIPATKRLPSKAKPTSSSSTSSGTSRCMRTFYTKKEWQAVTDKRQSAKGWAADPTPFVHRHS